MEEAAKLISALAALAWPALFIGLAIKLFEPIRALVVSARARRFTLKVAGNELTMEELTEQQRILVSDLQNKLAELESRSLPSLGSAAQVIATAEQGPKKILWVDDNPRNNSMIVASLEERGMRVDIALNTEEAISKIQRSAYDIVISDMGRPGDQRAGITLTKRVKELAPMTPVFIYCGAWAARNLRDEAISAGASEITSSPTTLLAHLAKLG